MSECRIERASYPIHDLTFNKYPLRDPTRGRLTSMQD
jgi:hypothetical protein